MLYLSLFPDVILSSALCPFFADVLRNAAKVSSASPFSALEFDANHTRAAPGLGGSRDTCGRAGSERPPAPQVLGGNRAEMMEVALPFGSPECPEEPGKDFRLTGCLSLIWLQKARKGRPREQHA